MSVLDIYYRAFKEYRKETVDNTLCEKDRKAIIQSETDSDKLESTKYLCRIEEDWIKAIEEGLEFFEKAVAEERQFIRTNGEVVPIEKVKKVSKDSVEHLAKHSEMITHVPEEEDDLLIPDKLYMVEKLSDYAVYENRFLYMALCYLRDFIEYRLEKIETLRRTYIGDMSVEKKIVSKKRTLTIEAKVYEERTDNPFPIADEGSAKMVKRIQDCHTVVSALLGTELMTQVAKSPMIKPPIVKTNVLKMNNNFKRALACYDFVASYKGLGYTYEEVKFNFAPFSEQVADEIAESLNLTAFTAYKFGNEIEDVLEREYRDEEARRREAESKKLAERVKRLKKRALESNKTLEEYMLVLEDRNRMLEKDSEELAVVRREVETLTKQIEELNQEKNELSRQVTQLQADIEEKEREIAYLNQKYIEDMSALKKEHEEELAKIQTEHEAEISAMKLEFAEKLQSTIEEYELKLDEKNAELEALQTKLEETVEECSQKELVLNEKIRDIDAAQKRVVDEYEGKTKEIEARYRDEFAMQDTAHQKTVGELKEENAFMRGQLDGIRVQQGLLTPSTENTSRERFLELQEEFAAFESFFKQQWKLTKKEIRKQVLWAKREKPAKKSKK